jgi:hypothetical protein
MARLELAPDHDTRAWSEADALMWAHRQNADVINVAPVRQGGQTVLAVVPSKPGSWPKTMPKRWHGYTVAVVPRGDLMAGAADDMGAVTPGSPNTDDYQGLMHRFIEHHSTGPDAVAARIHAAYDGYVWMDLDLARATVESAFFLDTNAYDLTNLIRAESQFSPRAQSILGPLEREMRDGSKLYAYYAHPSQHTGLIQFSHDAATEVGTTQARLFGMTAAQQMPYVARYLAARMPVDTKQRLFLSVLHPGEEGDPRRYQDGLPTLRFPQTVIDAQLRVGNRIATPADYIAFIERHARLTSDGDLVESKEAYTHGSVDFSKPPLRA